MYSCTLITYAQRETRFYFNSKNAIISFAIRDDGLTDENSE